jgi:hypothetical protein
MDRVIQIRIVAFIFAVALLLFFVFLDIVGWLGSTIFMIAACAVIIHKLRGWWLIFRLVDKVFLDNSDDR